MDNQLYDYVLIGAGPAGIGFMNAIKTTNNLKIAFVEGGLDMNFRTCKILQSKSCYNCSPNKCPMIHGIGGASLLGGYKLSCFPAGTFLNNILSKHPSDTSHYNHILERFANLLNLDESKNLSSTEIRDAEFYYKAQGYSFKYYKSYICEIEQFKLAYSRFLNFEDSPNIATFFPYEVYDCKRDNNVYNVYIKKGQKKYILLAKHLIFATGRSGLNLLNKLNHKLELRAEENHLEVGIRLEFPSHIFPDIDKYHNDLKLHRNNVRTFCSSKNGRLSPYYSNGIYIVDGYFCKHQTTSFTNLALMYRLPQSKFDSTIHYIKNNIKKISHGKPIIQDYRSLQRRQRPDAKLQIKSSINFLQIGSILDIYPSDICNVLIKEVIYFVKTFIPEKYHNQINVIAPTLEYYWPSFPIDEDFKINDNIYFIGDCCGKYRGILQAFVAGAILGNRLLHKNA